MEHAPARGGMWQWGAIAAALVATALLLRLEGRVWWCDGGEPWLWVTDVWTRHCSQHLADPYSLTHLSHGLIFYAVLVWAVPRWRLSSRLLAAVLIASFWEVLENSPLIINRYRESTMSLDYLGDSVGNAMGDILSCIAGFWLARWMGVARSMALFIAIEIVLLIMMRDNLTLNVLMLIYPVQSIKAWQGAGHIG